MEGTEGMFYNTSTGSDSTEKVAGGAVHVRPFVQRPSNTKALKDGCVIE
jgi:hypothetical protein